MKLPKNNHVEYVTEKTLEIMMERGKRKQEFIGLRKQEETKKVEEQEMKAKIRLHKVDAKVEKTEDKVAEDKEDWIQQDADEIRREACEGSNTRVFEVVRKLTFKRKVRETSPQQEEETFEAFYKILFKETIEEFENNIANHQVYRKCQQKAEISNCESQEWNCEVRCPDKDEIERSNKKVNKQQSHGG